MISRNKLADNAWKKFYSPANVQKIINFFIEAGNNWYGWVIIKKKTGTASELESLKNDQFD